MISMTNVSKNYGELQVLREINHDFGNAKTTVIIGASGSGKSTMLRCINLLVSPDCGVIKINGTENTKMSKKVLSENVGMVFQQFNLFGKKM